MNALVRFERLLKLLLSSLFGVLCFRIYKKEFFKSSFEIFFYSLPVIFLTSFFTGAVLTIQTYSGLEWLANSNTVARVVTVAITTELGPVLTGLMISGRIASAIAAEIATMNVMDQINALRTLSINPYRYLVYPKILACLIVMPLLLVISNTIGIMGSWFMVTFKYGLSSYQFLNDIKEYLVIYKLMAGLTKAVLFGFFISFVACFVGLNSTEGASGVGKATTNAVVISSILILIGNYFITFIFFGS